jgi:hypothetical protein
MSGPMTERQAAVLVEIIDEANSADVTVECKPGHSEWRVYDLRFRSSSATATVSLDAMARLCFWRTGNRAPMETLKARIEERLTAV